MDDIRYEELILEEIENERKEVFEALKKIANSRNADELVKNLKTLKNVYILDKAIGGKNLNKAISEINFDLLKVTKHVDKQFEKSNKVAVVVMFIGAIIGFMLCSVKDMVMDKF